LKVIIVDDALQANDFGFRDNNFSYGIQRHILNNLLEKED
jgi:hypothetical protein